MSRQLVYRAGVIGAITVLAICSALAVFNPGLSRSQLEATYGVLVVLAFVFVGMAIGAHLRGGSW
jgi:hypothetical protein